MAKSFKQVFEEHTGKVSDKWQLYVDEWDRLFTPYQQLQARILEIGVQNGGSLEIWSKCFPNAEKIIGCDVDPKCEVLRYDDPRITVIVEDANSDEGASKILLQSETFDIIVDDGSHKSSDVVRSFGRYFPHLNNNGIYVIEDLHCSYWKSFEGGLYNPLSSISFFKRLADITNFEHWRNNKSRGMVLDKFAIEYGFTIDDMDLARIHSIEFVNSLCIIKKLFPENNVLGKRVIVGLEDSIAGGWNKYNGTSIQDFTADVTDDVNLDVFELIAKSNSLSQLLANQEQSIQKLTSQIAEKELTVQTLSAQVAEKVQEVQSFQAQMIEREQQDAAMQAKLIEWEKQGEILSTSLIEKEQSLNELSKQVVDQNQQKLKSEEDLLQKVHTLQTLLLRLARKQEELESLENENKVLADKLVAQSMEAKSFSSQLWEIKNSHAWDIVQFLWKFRLWLFPLGSRRARSVRSLINSLKVIKNEGLISFFKNMINNMFQSTHRNRRSTEASKEVIQRLGAPVALVHPSPIYIPNIIEETIKSSLTEFTVPTEPDDPSFLWERVIQCIKYNNFIISISHDDYLTINFGVQMFINDEQKIYQGKEISYIHLYPLNGVDYLKNDSPLVIGVNVDSNHLGQYFLHDIVNLLEKLNDNKYACKSLSLHQFKGWTFKALNSVIISAHPDHLFFYIHDYYAVCPQYTLLRNQREFCNAPTIDSNSCMICTFREKRVMHLPLVRELFLNFPILTIAPSKRTLNLWKRVFPELDNKIRLEPHVLLKETSQQLATKKYKTIRIAYAGQGVPQKGWDTWRRLVDRFGSLKEYEMYHLGSRVGEFRELFESVRVTPENRTAMLDALCKNQIDVLFHWSLLPETFSYVLYEAIGAGCFVITTNSSGNVADYVTENKNGLVFDSYNSLVDYLSTPDNLRKDLIDFRKRYPKNIILENNEVIANLVKNSNSSGV